MDPQGAENGHIPQTLFIALTTVYCKLT